MNLYFRFLWVLIASIFKDKVEDIRKPASLNFHVLPTDLDLNMHMNNGRYLTIMDLGRLDLIMRSGLLKLMIKQKSVPVLSSSKMRFRLPLDPFQAYRLETKVLCWDERWVYIEQHFVIAKGEKAGAIAAIGLVKGGFYDRSKKEMVPTQVLLDAADIKSDSPAIPAYVTEWQKAEGALRGVTAENR